MVTPTQSKRSEWPNGDSFSMCLYCVCGLYRPLLKSVWGQATPSEVFKFTLSEVGRNFKFNHLCSDWIQRCVSDDPLTHCYHILFMVFLKWLSGPLKVILGVSENIATASGRNQTLRLLAQVQTQGFNSSRSWVFVGCPSMSALCVCSPEKTRCCVLSAKCPRRLVCLSIFFPADGAVWESCRTFRRKWVTRTGCKDL